MSRINNKEKVKNLKKKYFTMLWHQLMGQIGQQTQPSQWEIPT
jgi:hypothetical protein